MCIYNKANANYNIYFCLFQFAKIGIFCMLNKHEKLFLLFYFLCNKNSSWIPRFTKAILCKTVPFGQQRNKTKQNKISTRSLKKK